MITIFDFKRECEKAKSAEDVKTAIENVCRKYGIDIECEAWDGTDKAKSFFGTDDVTTRTLGNFSSFIGCDVDSNELIDETGKVFAREEHEIYVTVFESYVDPASNDYLYTYTIYVDGEREY